MAFYKRPAFIVNVIICLGLGALFWAGLGFGGFLFAVGLYGLVAGVIMLATGRVSWAGLASRGKAGIATGVAAAMFLTGFTIIGVSNPTSTSSPSSSPIVAESPEPLIDLDNVERDAVDDGEVVSDLGGAAANVHSASAGDHVANATALDVLATLEVKGRAPKTGYARDQFSDGWKDPDHNGCDARNDMLARDFPDETKDGPCKVLTGTLNDPYTGTVIHFQRGNETSTAVQIDHMVALSNAWQTGAQQLTAEQRLNLANDPLNLQSTDGPTNQKKGAGDAATWLPPQKGFRCEYVARQVSVKAAYHLWVTQAEHDAIAGILAACPDQKAYQSTLSPYTEPTPTPSPVPVQTPEPVQTPAPAPVKTADPAPAKTKEPEPVKTQDPAPTPAAPAAPAGGFANCDAARAAGAAPLYAGQPGYSTKLDRDKDGIACE